MDRFDYSDGDFIHDMGGGMFMDFDGNFMQDMGGGMAMDMVWVSFFAYFL